MSSSVTIERPRTQSLTGKVGAKPEVNHRQRRPSLPAEQEMRKVAPLFPFVPPEEVPCISSAPPSPQPSFLPSPPSSSRISTPRSKPSSFRPSPYPRTLNFDDYVNVLNFPILSTDYSDVHASPLAELGVAITDGYDIHHPLLQPTPPTPFDGTPHQEQIQFSQVAPDQGAFLAPAGHHHHTNPYQGQPHSASKVLISLPLPVPFQFESVSVSHIYVRSFNLILFRSPDD